LGQREHKYVHITISFISITIALREVLLNLCDLPVTLGDDLKCLLDFPVTLGDDLKCLLDLLVTLLHLLITLLDLLITLFEQPVDGLVSCLQLGEESPAATTSEFHGDIRDVVVDCRKFWSLVKKRKKKKLSPRGDDYNLPKIL